MPITSAAANTTSLVSSAVAILILLVRVWISRNAEHVTLLSKWLCGLSVIICAARIPVAHYLLEAIGPVDGTSPTELTNRSARAENTAVLTLTARCLSTTFLWLQVTLLQRFYARVVDHIQWTRRAVMATWFTIIATYVACILATFLECQPLRLYWDLEQQPQCARAYLQLFLQGACNILLDIMLLVIAFPIVLRRNLNRMQILQVVILMLIGTFCIIVTGIKLAYIVGANSNQAARSFWASVQLAVSAFVANAPTIYGCLRLRKRKRKPSFVHHLPEANMPSQPKSKAVHKEEIELGLSDGCEEGASLKSTMVTEGSSKQAQREKSWLDD